MAQRGVRGNFEGWYRVLEVCRSLGKNGVPFTAEGLNHAIKFEGTKLTTDVQMASAWLGKFARWGYVDRKEPDRSNIGAKGGRPKSTYQMTNLGNTCTENPGPLTRLLRYIALLRSHRGSPEEARIYNNLFILAGRIERNEPYDKKLEKEADPNAKED